MKTVLITGASSGIGKAYAYEYAKRGNALIITARRENILREIAEDISMKYHVSCDIITIDLSEAGAAEELMKQADERKLRVDILVNCAGFATKGLLSDSDFDKQAREMNVNVKALTELTYLCIGRMAEKQEGLVINVASASGLNPIPYNAVYSATKAYVLSFSQSVDYEYRDKGVRVLAVCPQATNTHFFDKFDKMSDKMREPEDVVRTTFRAIRRGKSVCTDGFFCGLQSFMSHVLSRRMCVRITGKVGKSVWGK